MTVVHAAGLDDGDWGQVAGIDILIEFGGVRDVCLAGGLGTHELGLVLEGIADVAVLVEAVRLGGIGNVKIPVFAEVLEGNIVSDEIVTDALLAGGRDGEGRVLRGKSAIAVVAGIVVIDEVVVSLDAVWVYRPLEGLKVVGHRRNAGLADVAAVDVAAAAVAVLIVEVIRGGLRVGIFDLIGREAQQQRRWRWCRRWRRRNRT